jgi:hypothetical protein
LRVFNKNKNIKPVNGKWFLGLNIFIAICTKPNVMLRKIIQIAKDGQEKYLNGHVESSYENLSVFIRYLKELSFLEINYIDSELEKCKKCPSCKKCQNFYQKVAQKEMKKKINEEFSNWPNLEDIFSKMNQLPHESFAYSYLEKKIKLIVSVFYANSNREDWQDFCHKHPVAKKYKQS